MDTYLQDLDKCTAIAARLDKRVEEVFGHLGRNAKQKVAEVFAANTGMSYTSAYQIVTSYCRDGPSLVQCSSRVPDSWNRTDAKRLEHLIRISTLYQILNVPDDDESVKLMREINEKFEYPLKR